ncbi:MAG: BNR-repeat neuraminidase N-terminal domain-containing protein [Sphingobacteriaceae bacterium]
MKSFKRFLTAVFGFCLLSGAVLSQSNLAEQKKYKIPVLKGKAINPLLRIKINSQEEADLKQIELQILGSLNIDEIENVKVFYLGSDSSIQKSEKLKNNPVFGQTKSVGKKTILKGNQKLLIGPNYFWLSTELVENADLSGLLNVNVASVNLNNKTIHLAADNYSNRIGIALRQHNQDNVHTHRIPGLATANDGTLLSIYDVRYNSGRDLQGHMDIGLSRSLDKGKTWLPMQIVMDMGAWGGLPEKFNGVSDANILVDKHTGDIYIAGLWMYGVINAEGKWLEGLTEKSEDWNHQWKTKGSQPGFDVKQTAQFLIVKSTDNGKTWSKPVNLTKMCKQEDWWLWAPAPGQGITLKDGTIVFPTQGRNATGKAFSNITYSKDGGKTWKTSNPAVRESTTENMVVELSDGTLMLNMRSNANSSDTSSTNGRAIAVTKNMGQSWTTHPTSHNALPEPTCMASIIRHDYTQNGDKKSVLLFSNPNSKVARKDMTIKVSYDDGNTWSKDKMVLLDELKSRGYSCLTSIDNDTIGILYESSQSDLVFQTIKLKELL